MSRAGFDLSDRGVAGRACAGRARRLCLDRTRHLPRRRDTSMSARWPATRPPRPSRTCRSPSSSRAPTASRTAASSATASRPAAMPSISTLPRTPCAAPGRSRIYTDPKKAPVATQMFLVEDFVPDRIEFDLSADKKEIAPGELANVTVDGRFLYGAPAAGLALEGEVNLSTTREWERFNGFYFGLADEQEGDATRIPLTDLPLVGEDGKATFPVRGRPAAVDDPPAQRRRDGAHARERRPRRRALARPRRAHARRRASASSPNSPATRCRKAAPPASR